MSQKRYAVEIGEGTKSEHPKEAYKATIGTMGCSTEYDPNDDHNCRKYDSPFSAFDVAEVTDDNLTENSADSQRIR